MSGVFLSYRRADAQGWAGRLGAELADAFGDVARFFDLASIAPGADFRRAIEQAVAQADAVLVLIGPRWADARDAQDRPRLEQADDLVAAEVAHAVTLPVPVIPVLLGGAAMPAEAALPPPLRALCGRNAFELSDARWAFDRDRLFAALEAGTPLRRRAPSAAAASVSVGAGLEFSEGEIGRIAGTRGAAPAGAVDVLRGAVLRQAKIGDITGAEITPAAGTKA